MNAAEWMVNNAPGFAALTRSERSAVRDFALLWSVFEGRHIEGDEANFTTIQATCQRAIGFDQTGPAGFSSQLSYFRGRYLGAGAGARVDALMNNRTPVTRSYILSSLNGTFDKTHQIASGLVLIAYRLRNNLFHGTKWNDLMVDQMRNFRAGGQVLMGIMSYEPHRHTVL